MIQIFFELLTKMLQVFYGLILGITASIIHAVIIRICFKSVTETEKNPESNPEPSQHRVPATNVQEKTDKIRIKPKPTMRKPDQVSAILPDPTASISENTEKEEDNLPLTDQEMMQLLLKRNDDLKKNQFHLNESKSKPDASTPELRQHLPEGGKLNISQPFPCSHENSKEKQFYLNASAEEIDQLEEIPSPISNDPLNETGADKVQGEGPSPSISKEREQPSHSEKKADKGKKKETKFPVFWKKNHGKISKNQLLVNESKSKADAEQKNTEDDDQPEQVSHTEPEKEPLTDQETLNQKDCSDDEDEQFKSKTLLKKGNGLFNARVSQNIPVPHDPTRATEPTPVTVTVKGFMCNPKITLNETNNTTIGYGDIHNGKVITDTQDTKSKIKKKKQSIFTKIKKSFLSLKNLFQK